MGFIDSIKGLFKDKEESNIVPQLLGGDQVLVLAEIGFESNIAPQLRQRISDTLSNHDLYEKTNSMEANMELYEAELWEIQIDNDEDLFLSNTRYKDDLDVKKVVYDRVSDRRQLAGIKCAYRDRVMNEHDAQKGLELAERYRDSKGVAVFTKAVEYFEVTGAP